MGLCSVCFERFVDPVSLPCGHLFCRLCVQRTVDANTPTQPRHHCPTCRASYNIVTIDPALVPAYLRPYILPAIRPLFFDSPAPIPLELEDMPVPVNVNDKAELGMEITALRASCATWRQRAEVHAAANAGLIGFARAAKEHTMGIKADKAKALGRCEMLRSRLAEFISEEEMNGLMTVEVEVPSVSTATQQALPVFLMQPPAPGLFYEEIAPTLFGQGRGDPAVFGPNDIAAANAA
ncbi:hypothetical protein C8F01DRAFT_1019776, partial [Mycena amicta]